jgi:N-acetylneuraminic acid mutarotase
MNGFAASSGGFIYLGLGYNRRGGEGKDITAHYQNTYRYDPTRDTYERLADAPEPGCYAAVGEWNGQIFVVHGAQIEIGFHDTQDYKWAEGALKYDPAADRWTRIDAPRVKQRVFYMTQCTSSAVYGTKLFAVGGMGAKRDRTTVADYFDMELEAFFELPPIPEPRCCGGGGVVDHHLILAGGFYGNAQDTVALRQLAAVPTILPMPSEATQAPQALERGAPRLSDELLPMVGEELRHPGNLPGHRQTPMGLRAFPVASRTARALTPR